MKKISPSSTPITIYSLREIHWIELHIIRIELEAITGVRNVRSILHGLDIKRWERQKQTKMPLLRYGKTSGLLKFSDGY